MDHITPRAVLARMVKLVKYHKRRGGDPREERRIQGDLMVRSHHAVHVSRKRAVCRRPRGIQMEREPGRSLRPLLLQMSGRRHDNQTGGANTQFVARRSKREGRLTRARRRNREEIALRRGDEAVESRLLPAAKL